MGNKKNTGLGKAIIRKRFYGKGKKGEDGMFKHTTDFAEPMNSIQSITHENDLEAFLHTAQLAGTEFKAEKLNVKVISNENVQNPFLLTPEKEKEVLANFESNKSKLTIPRRPTWDEKTTASELQKKEREDFLDWRRGLAQLEEKNGLLLTPYERNLEIWRQLWRVVERSDLIVQIVDARNPLAFRSEDLEKYVKENGEDKKNLLLVNKADMLTLNQRNQWAKYFEDNDIHYVFFSAKIEKDMQEMEKENGNNKENENESDEDLITSTESLEISSPEKNDKDIKSKIYSAEELVDLMLEMCPYSKHNPDKKIIGLVGYPNVGKSSTINAVIGAKKVAVGSTPGKTKHFQTIHLSSTIIFCDCPGLVFPSFATTQAEMVCNGILPVDQLREYTGPIGLVCRHIPREVLETFYGIKINIKNEEEDDYIPRPPTAEEFLCPYAINRGYTKSVQGNPDEARAARYILKDYISGKLLYCHPPPEIEPNQFNQENFEVSKYIKNKAKVENTNQEIVSEEKEISEFSDRQLKKGSVAKKIDSDFFQSKPIIVAHTKGKFSSSDFTRATLIPSKANQQKPHDKKHNKGNKRSKTRTQWTAYDE